jgi:hypothetical protein
MIALNAWDEIVVHVRDAVLLWMGLFDENELQPKRADISKLFET